MLGSIRSTPFAALGVDLSGVEEQRTDDGDTFGRSHFAGGNHDEQFHKQIVHVACSCLDDKDVLVSNGVAVLDRRFAVGKLSELDLSRRKAEPYSEGKPVHGYWSHVAGGDDGIELLVEQVATDGHFELVEGVFQHVVAVVLVDLVVHEGEPCFVHVAGDKQDDFHAGDGLVDEDFELGGGDFAQAGAVGVGEQFRALVVVNRIGRSDLGGDCVHPVQRTGYHEIIVGLLARDRRIHCLEVLLIKQRARP
ncbi:hypothetical protein OGAPHI_003212 [Ogataea philodendri]|uniref:Uncharacterized protein n=1 Tax=Ogataea philodendri TaxID=1378263 RepID=A0A9P8P720_9ASCO|nr:uncharacterized protein OGAPHI_003212 [Ogataea philodendri]KAH3666763.1 hypothetical protein OGAPHI_003212 [Ogataea philodendri]